MLGTPHFDPGSFSCAGILFKAFHWGHIDSTCVCCLSPCRGSLPHTLVQVDINVSLFS